jgi:D-alanyl-D-alanine carboxypeptidase (penicillin-binding protein 5/6)
MLTTGCTKRSYDTEKQLSFGISSDLPLYSEDNMSSSFAVISYDEEKDDSAYEGDGAVVLVNDSSKESLVVRNAHERIYPASMTKIMTGLLVMENIEEGNLSLEDTVTLKRTITFDESNVGTSDLTEGCTVTVKNLLYGLLIRSYNDCAVILAEEIAGSQDAFVEMMNQKAEELGATNTHFVNPHGLHNDEHYTTAYDLYIIFSEFIKYQLAYSIDSLSSYDFTYTDSDGVTQTVEMTSTNGFLSGEYNLPEGYTLGSWKSGTTNAAGNCLIIEFIKDDTGDRYIAVIANAPSREDLYNDMTSLIKMG